MLGLEIAQFPIPGMIAFHEEHSARAKAGYTMVDWYELNGYERAMEVAMYRIDMAIEYQKYKASERRMQEEAAKHTKG